MIQRIQTIYLLIVVLISSFAPFLIPVLEKTSAKALFGYDQDYILYGFLAIAVLALIVLLLFKNRKLQLQLARLNILFNFVLLGFFVYWFLNLPGETLVSKKGIGILAPLISIVFMVLAHRAIKKDDELVKSVDRLR